MLTCPVLFAARQKTSSLGASRAVSSLVTPERSGRTRSRIGVSQSQREYRALRSPLHVVFNHPPPVISLRELRLSCICLFEDFFCVSLLVWDVWFKPYVGEWWQGYLWVSWVLSETKTNIHWVNSLVN